MPILLAHRFDDAELAQWQSALHAALPEETLVTEHDRCAAKDIDIALVANPVPGALRGLSSLRLVQSLWAGVDRLLADSTVPAHVPLARMVDPAMNDAMAQTVLWAALGLHRGFFAYASAQRLAQWRPLGHRRADELQVAVLGLGQMGRASAHRLAAQGYRVCGWSAHAVAQDGIDTASGDARLADVLQAADIVVNLLPLTPATRGLFDSPRLAQMRRGACLVNLARGAHVVEADLLAALDSGHIAHAVLDVFEQEPLPPGHPFWLHPCVTVLPHVAAPTDPRSAAHVVADNVRALRAGRPIAHLVDRQRGY